MAHTEFHTEFHNLNQGSNGDVKLKRLHAFRNLEDKRNVVSLRTKIEFLLFGLQGVPHTAKCM